MGSIPSRWGVRCEWHVSFGAQPSHPGSEHFAVRGGQWPVGRGHGLTSLSSAGQVVGGPAGRGNGVPPPTAVFGPGDGGDSGRRGRAMGWSPGVETDPPTPTGNRHAGELGTRGAWHAGSRARGEPGMRGAGHGRGHRKWGLLAPDTLGMSVWSRGNYVYFYPGRVVAVTASLCAPRGGNHWPPPNQGGGIVIRPTGGSGAPQACLLRDPSPVRLKVCRPTGQRARHPGNREELPTGPGWLIHSFNHSFTRSFVRSFIRSFIHSFGHSVNRPSGRVGLIPALSSPLG